MAQYANLIQLRQAPVFQLIYYSEQNRHNVPRDTSPMCFPRWNFEPHRLWRFSNWRNYSLSRAVREVDYRFYDDRMYDISRELYDRMYPALQVATLMLQRASPMFVRILRCPYDRDGKFDLQWAPSNADYDALQAGLDDLAVEYRVFSDLPNTNPRLGVCSLIMDYKDVSRVPIRIVMAVCPTTLEYIGSDAWLHAPEIQRANVLAALALVLVHELGHAVFRLRMSQVASMAPADLRFSIVGIREPMFYPEHFREIGHSVTKFLYGGTTNPLNSAPDSAWNRTMRARGLPERVNLDGSVGLLHQIDSSPNQDRTSFASFTISLESVCSLFRAPTWSLQRQILYLLPVASEAVVRTTVPFTAGYATDITQWGVTGAPNPLPFLP